MRIFIILCLLLVPLSASAKIYLSEIMWMGTDLSTADEWIEFQCRESDTDLSGYTLMSVSFTGSGSSEEELFHFTEHTLAESGSVFVLSNADAGHSRLLSEPAFVSRALMLRNDALALRLYDGSGALIDEVFAGSKTPFAGANTSGKARASMERIDFALEGSDPVAWRTSEHFFGFDTGSVVFGTPGFSAVPNASPPPGSSSGASSLSPMPSLEISELMADPIGSDESEWLEIRNIGTTALNLSGFVLRLGSKGQTLAGSGLLIPPDSLTVILKPLLLPLPNAGASVELIDPFGRVIDTLIYTSAKEGISIGRLDGEISPFCLPSPGRKNDLQTQELSTTLQAGDFSGFAPLTLNIETTLNPVKPRPYSCRIDFGDGTLSETCNPPSHRYEHPGTYNMFIEAMTQCGNTLVQTQIVTVNPNFSTSSSQRSSDQSGKSSTSYQCATPTSDLITISELYPHPEKDEESEWIELKNSSNETVQLCGWQIADTASEKSLDHYSIPAAGYLVLTGSLSLNDAGDTIRLMSPNGAEQRVSYDRAKAGVSFVKDSAGQWAWSARPTYGSANIITSDAPRLPVYVRRVIDGDTFVGELQNSSDLFPSQRTVRVRLLGIEAPESVHPTRQPEPGGKDASDFLRALIQDKIIELQFDTNIEDIYDRKLAYAYLPDGTLVQKILIEAGVARAYFRFPFSQEDLFRSFNVEPRYLNTNYFSSEEDGALKSKENSEQILYSIDPGIPDFSGLISEIYGHPSQGEEEWIELYNPLDKALALSGLTLQDTASSKKPFKFSSIDFLEPKGYLTIFQSRSKLAINNAGDELILKSPQGYKEKVNIPKLSEAESFMKVDSGWCVSTLSSLNERNKCIQPIKKTKIKNKKIIQKTIKTTVHFPKTSIPGIKLTFLPKSSSSVTVESGAFMSFQDLTEPQIIGSPMAKNTSVPKMPWTELSLLSNVILGVSLILQIRPRKKR